MTDTNKGFEIGKYYKHTGGGYLHILTATHTTMWEDTLVAETAGHDNALKAVGTGAGHAVHWVETTREDWLTNFSSVRGN